MCISDLMGVFKEDTPMADNFDDFLNSLDGDFDAGPAKAVKPLRLASQAHPTAPSMDNAKGLAYREDCKACRGTGTFYTWSGRAVGQCFKCKGQGFRMFKTNAADRAQKRAQAADRKVAAAATAWETFVGQYPLEAAWIQGSMATFDFARSMYDAIAKFGSLTERQLAACTNAANKFNAARAARQAAREEALAAAPVVDMAKIEAAFASARSSGLKSPKLRIGQLVISPAKAESKNAGALYVKGGKGFEAPYYGKIFEGKFIKSRDCDAATEALIVETAKDPLAAAVAYGKETGTCSCCGLELTNKLSIELGIGPICRAKWGLG